MALRSKVDKPETMPLIELELAIYKRYTRGASTFEAGKVYRFTQEQAMQLLTEQDNHRSVWKVYRPGAAPLTPEQRKEASVVDYSERPLNVLSETDDPTVLKPKAVEIGNEEEIASILATGDVVEV